MVLSGYVMPCHPSASHSPYALDCGIHMMCCGACYIISIFDLPWTYLCHTLLSYAPGTAEAWLLPLKCMPDAIVCLNLCLHAASQCSALAPHGVVCSTSYSQRVLLCQNTVHMQQVCLRDLHNCLRSSIVVHRSKVLWKAASPCMQLHREDEESWKAHCPDKQAQEAYNVHQPSWKSILYGTFQPSVLQRMHPQRKAGVSPPTQDIQCRSSAAGCNQAYIRSSPWAYHVALAVTMVQI